MVYQGYWGVYRNYPQQVNQAELPGPKQQNVPAILGNFGPVTFPKLGQRQPEGPVLYYYPTQGFQLKPSTNFGPVPFPKLGQWQPSGPVQYNYPAQGFQPLVSLNFGPIPFPPRPTLTIYPSLYNYLEFQPQLPPPAPPNAALVFPPVPVPTTPGVVWTYWMQPSTQVVTIAVGTTFALQFTYWP